MRSSKKYGMWKITKVTDTYIEVLRNGRLGEEVYTIYTGDLNCDVSHKIDGVIVEWLKANELPKEVKALVKRELGIDIDEMVKEFYKERSKIFRGVFEEN